MTRAEFEAAAECTGTRVEWLGFSGETRGGEPLGQVWPVHGFNDDGSFAMATEEYNILVTILIMLLGRLVDLDVWQVESQAAEVGLPTGRGRFPDVALTRKPTRHAPHPENKKLVLLNPSVAFEALSDTTSEVDLEDKPADYLSVPSVTDYIVIDQDQAFVLHHRRSAEPGPPHWDVTRIEDLAAAVTLTEPAVSLPLGEIYARVLSN